MSPNKLVLYQDNSLALVMLSQASGKSADDLLLLDGFPFSYDSGISIATTLVEGVLLEFPLTQELLESTSIMDTTSRLQVSKSDTYYPQTVSDSALDGPLVHLGLESSALSEPVEAVTMTESVPTSQSIREKRKELWERRFTYPEKMKPATGYASEGR